MSTCLGVGSVYSEVMYENEGRILTVLREPVSEENDDAATKKAKNLFTSCNNMDRRQRDRGECSCAIFPELWNVSCFFKTTHVLVKWFLVKQILARFVIDVVVVVVVVVVLLLLLLQYSLGYTAVSDSAFMVFKIK